MSETSNQAVYRSTTALAANIATILFGIVIVLQLLMAIGILPVTMFWGGRQTELTLGLRLTGVAAAIILALFAYVIRRRAGLISSPPPSTLIKILSWVITAFMVFNTLGNLTSQSMTEKIIFTPLTILLAICCFIVSISKSS
ncbi:MAG: hypothetical protein ACK2U0_15295 [Candidatus Promineifilaceae bacterium]|jgi:predicted Abi (CAAX) family protease